MRTVLAHYVTWLINVVLSKARKFIFVNHSQTPEDEQLHGKAVFLNPDNHRVPFHTLFIVHECCVCGRWPFLSDGLIDDAFLFQDRIGIPVDGNLASKNTHTRPANIPTVTHTRTEGTSSLPSSLSQSQTAPSSSQFVTFTHPFSSPQILEEEVELLRDEPTWKACVMEGTTWNGSAQENTDKYLSLGLPNK